MMNGLSISSNDDWGGRVCRQCDLLDDDYVATLFAYSAYTKRDADRGDTLFLATHDSNGELVTVEFSKVPYRLFLTLDTAKAVCLDGCHGKDLQLAIERYAELHTCTRKVDSFCSEHRELVEVRFHSRKRYMEVFQYLEVKNIPVAIDGAHDALQGLDALLNLGIPGAAVTICLQPTAGVPLSRSRWRIDSPTLVCVHGANHRLPPNLTEVAIGMAPDKNICVGFCDQVAWFGEAEAKIFAKQMTKIRPTVIVVRNKEKTMRQLYNYAPSFFSTLFSVLPSCKPALSSDDRPLLHGLGVLIFDVANISGTTLEVHPCQWLDGFRLNRCLENRWMEALSSHTNTNHKPTDYESFSATMVLRYADAGMVCELSEDARVPYKGGHTIPPRPVYVLQQPVGVFDFKSHYPSVAKAINAGKDTYVSRGGQWELGTFGGFVTSHPGGLAEALKERLEERMRIVDDPAQQSRARFLKEKINNLVGMCGKKSHPYADTRVAACITAVGRRLLQACHRHVSDVTLAGYTDSLFLKLPVPVSPLGCDLLKAWLSEPVLEEYATAFKYVIGNEMQSMSSSTLHQEKRLMRFECRQITVAALLTAAAHAHAIGYLTFDTPDGNPRVDIQVKGTFNSPAMECVRLFNEALVRVAIGGEFFLRRCDEFCLADIHVLERMLPTQILTGTGWKTALKTTSSLGARGVLHAVIYFEDGTESRHSFLPRAKGEGLVNVTHIFSPEDATSCLNLRRESCVLMAESFCRRLCRSQLNLDKYVVDRDNRVLVKLHNQKCKSVPLSEAARNGFCLNLKQYHRRWMQTCLDTLKCGSCQRLLPDTSQSCYTTSDRKDENGYELFHKACRPEGMPLSKAPSSMVSRFIRTALSAILVAGTKSADEAVSRLIDLYKKIESLPVKEDPPSRPYDRVLAELKREAADLRSSKEYIPRLGAFACFPDRAGSWLYLPRAQTSTKAYCLLFEAMRVTIRHGKYVNANIVLEAVSAYPADRLRFSPPPVLKDAGQAPVQDWQEVMDELAKSPQQPVLSKTALFKCQVCDTAFDLKIGVCGHLACSACSLAWNACATCRSEWKVLRFNKTPQMNYHPSVFPFKEWYEYLPVTGWWVYCGPKELIYDSSSVHIIALASGEASC